MGFGGGSSGTYSLQNHTHTATAFDGGALDANTTLINSALMQTWKVSKALELLDTHTAVGAESSYTFTPSSTLDFNDYVEIIVLISGQQTLAGAQKLQMQLNGITATYGWQKNKNSGGALTGATATAQSTIEVCGDLDASRSFSSKVTIQNDKSNSRCSGFIESYVNSAGVFDQYGFMQYNVAITGITSIKTLMDTSTWTIGSRIDCYGVRRT